MFMFLVFEASFVSIVSLLKSIFCQTSICFYFVVVVVVVFFHSCLIHYTFGGYTCPIEGAGGVSAVTFWQIFLLGCRLLNPEVVS